MTNEDAVPDKVGDSIDAVSAAMRQALLEAYAEGLRDGMSEAAEAVENIRSDMAAMNLPVDVSQVVDCLMGEVAQSLTLACYRINAPKGEDQ